MKDDALHSPLAPLRLHGHAPLGIVDVQVRGHRLAIGTQCVQRAAHVADEQPARGGLFDQGHRTGRHAVDVRQRGEFTERDGDNPLGASDRLRKRLVRLPGRQRRGRTAAPLPVPVPVLVSTSLDRSATRADQQQTASASRWHPSFSLLHITRGGAPRLQLNRGSLDVGFSRGVTSSSPPSR